MADICHRMSPESCRHRPGPCPRDQHPSPGGKIPSIRPDRLSCSRVRFCPARKGPQGSFLSRLAGSPDSLRHRWSCSSDPTGWAMMMGSWHSRWMKFRKKIPESKKSGLHAPCLPRTIVGRQRRMTGGRTFLARVTPWACSNGSCKRQNPCASPCPKGFSFLQK
jgi:hypothetical protein